MTVETLTNLLYCSFPVVVIVTVVIYVIVNKNKDKPVDTTPPQFYGMRSPTLEEAAEIKAEVAPRNGKVILVLSLVMLPLAVCAGGAAISIYGEEDLGVVIIMGSVAAGVLLMYIGMVSMPLYRIISLHTRRYSVGECYFDDVKHLIRVNYRGIPCDVYHAVIKDAIGTTWEADLPKNYSYVQTGARCLVVIHASEKKVNRSPTNGKSLYRRDIFVPRDELMRYK